MLRHQYPKTNFEVVVPAMPAINSHVVRVIAKSCARWQADLFILYVGNNEVVGPYGSGWAHRSAPMTMGFPGILFLAALASSTANWAMSTLPVSWATLVRATAPRTSAGFRREGLSAPVVGVGRRKLICGISYSQSPAGIRSTAWRKTGSTFVYTLLVRSDEECSSNLCVTAVETPF